MTTKYKIVNKMDFVSIMKYDDPAITGKNRMIRSSIKGKETKIYRTIIINRDFISVKKEGL